MFMAWARSRLGDDAAVFECLDRGRADGSPSLFDVNVLPPLLHLRGQERFESLLDQLHLPA